MKICSECKEEKPFNQYDLKLGKLRSNCKACVSKYGKKHYLLNKQYYLDKAKKSRNLLAIKVRKYLLEYYTNLHCVDCGESDPRVLEFDHLHNKTYEISQMVRRRSSLKLIIEEISKCDVVCANCHRRRTARRSNWYKNPAVAE